MVKLSLNIILMVSLAIGATYLNYEEDLRANYSFTTKDISAEINSIGGSIRQVFSDKKGDRWILYLQAEAEHNFSEIMAHQLYGRFKGPMGKWNISIGRIPLQWGLLTNWSPERMPYSSPYKLTGILMSDNGILINGTVGMVDYGISLTQGFGMGEITSFPGPGLVTGRVGISPMIGGELVIGISGSFGTSYRSTMGHGEDAMPVEHNSLALDITAFVGRGTIRLETGAEEIKSNWEARGFLETEYQLLPKLTLHGAGLFSKMDHWNGTAFIGVSTKLKSVTIRGGYEYEQAMEEKQTVVLQLYRQFSHNR